MFQNLYFIEYTFNKYIITMKITTKYIWSNKNFNREQYQLLKQLLRAGDTWYVKSIDMFEINYNQILSEWHNIVSLGVNIIFLIWNYYIQYKTRTC